jgi:phage tail-like protein
VEPRGGRVRDRIAVHGTLRGARTGVAEMPVKFSRDVLKGTTKNSAGDFNQQSRFNVEIEGVTIGGIHKVDGLDHEHEMVTYQDADDHFQRIRPGRQKVGTLVLERDWSSNTEFYEWFRTVYEGNVQRKSISIVYLTDDGGESSRVNLLECWPKKWGVSNLNARSSGHVSEKLEIMYEKIDFV